MLQFAIHDYVGLASVDHGPATGSKCEKAFAQLLQLLLAELLCQASAAATCRCRSLTVASQIVASTLTRDPLPPAWSA